jgi:alanyl-tRNA synthetase
MTTDKLRTLYLDFFKSKQHRIFPSDSLVPADDPSLVLTGAGVYQFKPYFLGLKKDLKRAASCQKCLRTADLDRVGKTAYHHTFFEMLGNFSFGDYFKEEAIAWGWEFVTQALGLPKSRLWVSVYEEDEEAFNIWKTKIGVPEERIVRMDAVDNFWPSNAKVDGPNGPCGPCSEIYVGEVPGKGVEIWNLVFTQFDRQSDGTLLNLPQKNIDTGMGLERTAAVLQGVESNFDSDNFTRIRLELRGLLKKGGAFQVAHENAVMDHVRAVVFSIGDGALPSNEGRGYVIRKLIRLASDHFQKAGAAKEGTLSKLVGPVIDVMKPAYPELVSRQNNISSMIENEQRGYLEVLGAQIPRLEKELSGLSSRLASSTLKEETAALAFKYYDTYGLPLDNIVDCLNRARLAFDQSLFDRYLEEQKNRSRQTSKIAGEIFSKTDVYELVEGLPPTEFLGYQTTEASARLLRVIEKETPALIFDKTPFYAESGGQVGDTGWIEADDFQATVLDAQWMEKCVAHKVQIERGRPQAGKAYSLKVDDIRRADIMKNHTATHLLHSALRRVLGDHVKQSGSLVAPDRLRFDFTHFKAVEPELLEKVEDLVNAEIKKNVSLDKKVLSKDQALEEGAIAFFGEKYGDQVRVVSIGDFSKELCGGTHLHSTGQIGFFKIISESSIQAGVRRIEAVTGQRALEVLAQKDREIDALALSFKIHRDFLLRDLKVLKERVCLLKNKLLTSLAGRVKRKVEDDFQKAHRVGGVKLLIEKIDGADTELLTQGVAHLKTLGAGYSAFFISSFEDKISFVIAGSADLVGKGFHSGKIVKGVAQMVEGSGGGRPDFAVGGGKMVRKEAEAIAFGKKEIEDFLRSLER